MHLKGFVSSPLKPQDTHKKSMVNCDWFGIMRNYKSLGKKHVQRVWSKTLSARSSPFFGKWINPPGTVVIRLTKTGSTGTKQINVSTSIHILNKKNETGSAFTTTYCMQLIFLLLEMNFKKINKQSYKVICIIFATSVRILHWITVQF